MTLCDLLLAKVMAAVVAIVYLLPLIALCIIDEIIYCTSKHPTHNRIRCINFILFCFIICHVKLLINTLI